MLDIVYADGVKLLGYLQDGTIGVTCTLHVCGCNSCALCTTLDAGRHAMRLSWRLQPAEGAEAPGLRWPPPATMSRMKVPLNAQVVGWLSGYQETLKELGLEDSEIVFPEGPDRGMTLLVGKYIARMRGTLHTWFVNILQVRPLLQLCANAELQL